MKKMAFRELQAHYSVSIDHAAPVLEPILVERNGEPLGMLVPLEEYDAYQQWRQQLYEPLPQEPPRTPEGDLEALAAVERLSNLFTDIDPELWRDVIDDESLALENTWLFGDEENT